MPVYNFTHKYFFYEEIISLCMFPFYYFNMGDHGDSQGRVESVINDEIYIYLCVFGNWSAEANSATKL